jgi:O-antigen/teichoic acid export membrane protein
MLGKTLYGELGMVQSTVGMFGTLAGFALGLTANKHVAELRERDRERAGRIIGLSGIFAVMTGGIMSLALLIFAPWLADNTLNAPHLADILRIGAIILFLNGINGAQTGALAGFEAFKTIAFVNLFVGLTSFPILVAGAYYGGLTGAVWGLAINLGFNWLFNHIALRREARNHMVPLSFRHCLRERSVLASFSLPAALAGIIIAPSNWASRAMLANQPGGYDELGIFTAAIIFQTSIFFVTGMIAKPLLSMVSNAGEDISDKLGTINIIGPWSLGIIVLLPLLCFPEIGQVILGENYSGYTFKVTFSLVIFYSVNMIFMAGLTRVLVARNLLWWSFLSHLLRGLVLIISALYFVRLGAIGLALSFVLAHLINTIILLPIYYLKNMVPKGTLISFESLTIWLTLCVLVSLNIYDVSLFPRMLAFLLSIFLVIATISRINWQASQVFTSS